MTIAISLVVVLDALAAFIVLATRFRTIPYLGSVANVLTIQFAHRWIPALALLLLAHLPLLAGGGPFVWGMLAICACAIAGSVAMIRRCLDAVNAHGAGARFLASYQLEDVSCVRVETHAYTQGEAGEVLLNVYYVPDGQAGKPVVLYIHGGGWVQGDRNDHSYYSKVFATRGYVAVSVDYELSTPERHLARRTEAQLTHALAWVATHAAEYGADVDRLFLTGDSAGGNLALELAYKVAAGIYDEVDGIALPQTRAVSVTYPGVRPAEIAHLDDLVFGKAVSQMARSYTGCMPEDDPELYASLEPANHLSASTPPTQIMTGEGDPLVSASSCSELAGLLDAQGTPCRFVLVPYANHIFDNADGNFASQAFIALSCDWFDAYGA